MLWVFLRSVDFTEGLNGSNCINCNLHLLIAPFVHVRDVRMAFEGLSAASGWRSWICLHVHVCKNKFFSALFSFILIQFYQNEYFDNMLRGWFKSKCWSFTACSRAGEVYSSEIKALSLLSSRAELRMCVMVCRIIFNHNLRGAWTAFRWFCTTKLSIAD